MESLVLENQVNFNCYSMIQCAFKIQRRLNLWIDFLFLDHNSPVQNVTIFKYLDLLIKAQFRVLVSALQVKERRNVVELCLEKHHVHRLVQLHIHLHQLCVETWRERDSFLE